jgi:hypothetical protein
MKFGSLFPKAITFAIQHDDLHFSSSLIRS